MPKFSDFSNNAPYSKNLSTSKTIRINRLKFCNVWRKEGSTLLGYAKNLCGGDADQAQELTASAALKLLAFIERHNEQITHPRALLYQTVKRLAIDQFRRARRERGLYDFSVDPLTDSQDLPLQTSTPNAEEQVETSKNLETLRKALALMPEETRMLFVHRFVEERNYREIAERFRISEPLARKRVQKLRAQLAKAIKDPAFRNAGKTPRIIHGKSTRRSHDDD